MFSIFTTFWNWFLNMRDISNLPQPVLEALANVQAAATTLTDDVASKEASAKAVAEDQALLTQDQETDATNAATVASDNEALKSAKAAVVAALDAAFPTS